MPKTGYASKTFWKIKFFGAGLILARFLHRLAKDVVERELGDGPYLFGNWFTAADIMIGSMFIWKRIWGRPPDRPKLEAYVDRLLARPKAMKLGK